MARDPFLERILGPKAGEPRVRRRGRVQPSVALPAPTPEPLRDAVKSEGVEAAVSRRAQAPDFEKIRKETAERIRAVDTGGEDLDALLAKISPEAKPPGIVRRAIGGAARGFARGFGIPGAAGPEPVPGQLTPRQKLRQTIIGAGAKERVKEPFRRAASLRELERSIGTRRAITAGRIATLNQINELKPPGVSEGAWRIAQGSASEAISAQFPSGMEPGYAQALLQQTRRELVNLQESGVKGARGARPVQPPSSRAEVRRGLGLGP